MAVAAHRIVIDPPATGAWNMAVDEVLLFDAVERDVATLRFYGWCEPTLSLGYFQRYEDRQQHAASRDCAAVRRQTGGGAILHDRELTYSIALPASHPLAKRNEDLYIAVHDAFIAELRPAVESEDSNWRLTRRIEPCASSDDAAFLCFQRRARGDVSLSSLRRARSVSDRSRSGDSPDCKILGSAQRRYRGAVLQHGSLLLEKSPAAPELPGLVDLIGQDFPADQLAESLSVRLSKALQLPLEATVLAHELESNARDVANRKYGAEDWTRRR